MKEGNLVMVRIPNNPELEIRQRHYNTWLRVLFVDTDGSLIGEVEKIDRFEFTLYSIGDHVRVQVDKIQHVYKDGEQFCYGDNITICECKGLCLNK